MIAFEFLNLESFAEPQIRTTSVLISVGFYAICAWLFGDHEEYFREIETSTKGNELWYVISAVSLFVFSFVAFMKVTVT